jgi:hypothetical protein
VLARSLASRQSKHFAALILFQYLLGEDISSKLKANITAGCWDSEKPLGHRMYTCTNCVLCTMYERRMLVLMLMSVQIAIICPSA